MSGLPGRRHPLPDGAMCECHPERAAVANVQGETDSFGYETILMCQECVEAELAYEASEEARTGRCDWCKADATNLVWARSYDEGLDGPTYRVCGACKERQTRRLQEEMDAHDDWDWSEPDDDWDDPIDDCGMTGDGTCMNAGSEYCDFECPYQETSMGEPQAAGCRIITAEEFERLRDELSKVTAERDHALRQAKDEKSSADMYAKAWVRELGGKLIPKSHHIDACVLTTRMMRQRLERLEAEDRARQLADQVAEYGPFLGKRRGDW